MKRQLAQAIREIRVFDHYELTEAEPGQVSLTSQISPSSLNYYGHAHGGYLFTLCDQVAGLVARTLGATAVTLQANVNYLKAGQLGETLIVQGHCVHDGRKTKLVETQVRNEQGQLLTQASFTMFVTGRF